MGRRLLFAAAWCRRTASADAPHGLFPAPLGVFSAGMDLLLAALAYFPLGRVFSEALPSRQLPSTAFFFCAAVFLFLFLLFSLPNFYYLWKRSDYFFRDPKKFCRICPAAASSRRLLCLFLCSGCISCFNADNRLYCLIFSHERSFLWNCWKPARSLPSMP